MGIPTNETIFRLLDRLAFCTADELESEWVEFKPWDGAKESLRVAVEYAVCFANAGGGAIIFGVADRTRGRDATIRGAQGYDLDTWRRGIFQATRPNLRVEVEELAVPEGTGTLLVVRAPRGDQPPYGTSEGLFKVRVGANCMPMDAESFTKTRVATGTLDWSGEPANRIELADLDPVEIARARNVLRRSNPTSELLQLDDQALLVGLGAIRGGLVTNAGLLLFGREDVLAAACPQNQVHYVFQISDTAVARNDSYRCGLLQVLERIEAAFTGPNNPEQELTTGFFTQRIPAFPVDVVREAVLNAVTHRSYLDPGEVLLRHTSQELVVTSPGGFLPGITPKNILRCEPMSRNLTLAGAFEKLRLVERAGIGRRRIFVRCLGYGKRTPRYETDGSRVTLRIYDGTYDSGMARLVAKWQHDGREIELDGLLVLSFLRDIAFIDTTAASELLQLERESAKAVLDQLAQPRTGILERRGRTKAVTYHLTKAVAKDLLGKAAYTRSRGLDPIRYAEMVKAFVGDHGSITPQECRELLGLGESQTARVEVSRHLRVWSGSTGFLRREGKGPSSRYYPRMGAEGM